MFTFLIIVELLISMLLILVILLQSSKGGGLAGAFGGGNVGMMFGVRRTADFLTKATQILAASFIALALIINIFFLPRAGGKGESVIQKSATSRQMTPQVPTESPVQPAPGQAAPQGK